MQVLCTLLDVISLNARTTRQELLVVPRVREYNRDTPGSMLQRIGSVAPVSFQPSAALPVRM